MDTMTGNQVVPIQVTKFSSFSVEEELSFDITLDFGVDPNDLVVNITNPLIGPIEKQLKWLAASTNDLKAGQKQSNNCIVKFKAPIVGLYNIKVEIIEKDGRHFDGGNAIQFQAKAYDLSKVFITGSSGRCRINESYEFGVDASEAGEGQLEIAVNEGEIPNQVQVLDNGKCIVSFIPEEVEPHVVDIKFNGHNVNGCPFVVQVDPILSSDALVRQQPNRQVSDTSAVSTAMKPTLIRCERVLVNSRAVFKLANVKIESINHNDILIFDHESRNVDYTISRDDNDSSQWEFEFKPVNVGDYSVELKPGSKLIDALPSSIRDDFPFSVKVFDFSKVIVTNVTDGVIGHPVYFFIDASQAGSGNLEIGVSTKTRTVQNFPESEGDAKICVNFTPTEAVDHTIDVKFNGRSVPNNPFLVRVAQYPQGRLPKTSEEILKCVPIDENIEFFVDYLDEKRQKELTGDSCTVSVIKPDLNCVKLDSVQLIKSQDSKAQARFKIKFEANKIGPYKFFISINNELLPGSPIISNVYNIHEVKVYFGQELADNQQPIGKINKPLTFTVDASRAGDGLLSLVVVPSLSQEALKPDVKKSEKGHGLYDLTFVPTEFAIHTINMSFNDRVVPKSPFIVDIIDEKGRSAMGQNRLSNSAASPTKSGHSNGDMNGGTIHQDQEINKSMAAMSLKQGNTPSRSKSAMSKEDELIQNIVVHGVSLKRTPVSSTGAFIIETNRMAHARDFDVLIADPSNSLVDVQCYLQQDGNLLAEWAPERVGTHRIEVLYKDRPVPGSPFITEAFDPSAVMIDTSDSKFQLLLDETIRLKINRIDAGQAHLDVVLTDPSGEARTIYNQAPRAENEEKTIDEVSFKPKLVGKHRISITFGGYEVPKSPVIFNVRDNRKPIKVSGTGLRCAEVNRTAQFDIESTSDGELKLRIECGDREIVPKVDRRDGTYSIKYKPTEIGYAVVSLYWDGSHIDGSPFSVPVNDLSKFSFMSAANKNESVHNQITLDYEPRLAREIIVDTTRCGPGELKAEAYCRANTNIRFTIPVNRIATGCHKLIFTCPPGPEQLASNINVKEFPIEATYLIRFYYNNLAVPETLASVSLSPIARSKKSTPSSSVDPQTEHSEKNNSLSKSASQRKLVNLSDCPVVALRGHGLVEAKCGEVAEFTIDGRSVGHGSPEVRFYCLDDEIRVELERIEDNLYKATYVANSSGFHTLNVLWDGKQVAGCPISVNVISDCDSSKVICTADSLKGGILGEEIKTFIDTRKAGPGELTALCTGPTKVAFCELLDRGDGTFVLYIKPQEAGRHSLTINYGGRHIPKSPFPFKVSGKPDPTRVRVYGPGVEHGVLSLYQSRFVCDTRGAGAGQLTVRIRGPKGAFRMETQRESQRDRTILCKYDPTEPGDYRIEIKWSGRHVPGSPFSVMIFDTQEELNRFLLSRQQTNSQLSKRAGPPANHVTPFQPTMVEYGHYSSNIPTAQQPKFRLQ